MPPTDPTDALNLVNAGYVADLYEQYRRDPASVDAEWRSLFDSGAGGYEPVAARAPEGTNGKPPADAPQQPRTEAPAEAPATRVPEGATPPPWVGRSGSCPSGSGSSGSATLRRSKVCSDCRAIRSWSSR